MSNIDYNMARGIAQNFISAAYYQHLNGKREQLINACANHLKDTKGYSLAFGIKVAIQEIAAFESFNSHADVDIDRCNSNLVVIHDRHNNQRLYYTIEDILKTASALTVRPIIK